MIQITMVHGDVLVEDTKKQYMQMAQIGMRLEESGSYLVATTPHSRAEVKINGQVVTLGPSSYMRIRGGETWWDQHREAWSKDAKLFLGRIWAHLARDRGDPDAHLRHWGGGGVRG